MNSSFSVTTVSLFIVPGVLFLVKVGEMNGSLSFPFPICIVLPLFLSMLALATHVPTGFLLSPGLPRLAHTVKQLDGGLCVAEEGGAAPRVGGQGFG